MLLQVSFAWAIIVMTTVRHVHFDLLAGSRLLFDLLSAGSPEI